MPKVTPKPAKQLRGGGLTPRSELLAKAKAAQTAEQQRLEKLRHKIESVCSGQWHDEIVSGRTNEYPVAGMVLGMAKVLTTGDMVSNNRGELGTRRWTPPQNVTMEDGVDRLSIARAGPATAHWPPAIRYDHTRPHESAKVYDPRKITVDDAPAWILRSVKLVDWTVKRANVRIRRGRAVIGFVEWCAFPADVLAVAMVGAE